jgi:hypothetical protein
MLQYPDVKIEHEHEHEHEETISQQHLARAKKCRNFIAGRGLFEPEADQVSRTHPAKI